MDQERDNHQKEPGRDVPASIPELTHRHLEAVLQLLKRAKAPDVALIEQAEAQLRQVIVALTPLSPEVVKQRLQSRRLTRKHLLDALRDACGCLDRALDEGDEGNIEHCTQHIQRCQSIVTAILTAW